MRIYVLPVLFSLAGLCPPILTEARAVTARPDLPTLIDAALAPVLIPGPQGSMILTMERSPTVPLSLLANETIGLAGAEIDVRLHASKRSSMLQNPALLDPDTGKSRSIAVPRGQHISAHCFSPDGRWIALQIDGDKGVELWLVETKTAKAKLIKGLLVNDIFVGGAVWAPDSQSLYINTRANSEAIVSKAKDAPTIEEANGNKVTARTYAYLLKSKEDESLFERYALAQIQKVTASSAKVEKIGKPGLYTDFEPSPDGRQLLVQRMVGPYSYAVPANLFARTNEVWTIKDGKEKTVLKTPLADDMPPEGERKGARDIMWQPDYPARLLWVEALDGGDPRSKAEFRDRLLLWDFPFEGSAEEVLRLQDRFSGMQFFRDKDKLLVRESNPDTDMTRIQRYDLSAKPATAKALLEYSVKDSYKFPGRVVTAQDGLGTPRIMQSGSRIYLAGSGRNPKGEKPYLDSFDMETADKKTIFASDPEMPYIEEFAFFQNADPNQIVLTRESPSSPPNLWFFNPTTSARRAITRIQDNVPAMTEAVKKPFIYKRKDGLSLSGTLYTPKNIPAGKKLPAIVWAYPEEYRSSDLASQVRVSDKRYSRPGPIGIAWLVTQGYVVLDNASMPVVGEKESANNTFAEQIVSNAEAAVDALDTLGTVDRKRVAIGGHSYGAFMTANVLAHSDIFCAGLARSGAYNRSLTPFGFQAERRVFWEAKDFYMNVSPFYYAEKIKTPILFVHGKKDTNPGTLTLQTERMFNAVRGVGGRARMVLLPYESHSYRSRENILLMHAETLDWLQRWCGEDTSAR